MTSAAHRTADLRRVLSGHLSPEALDVLVAYCQGVEIEQGTLLFRQGDQGDGLYFLEAGYLSVVLRLPNGEIKPLRTFGPGSVVGEMALYSGRPRSADVVARTPCRLQWLDPERFHRLEREHPRVANEFQLFILNLLASRLAEANQQRQAVVDNAADGIFTMEERGRLRSFNPAAERMFGFSAAEVVDRAVGTLLPGVAPR